MSTRNLSPTQFLGVMRMPQPHAEPSPYHDSAPLLHDLRYHLENGTPVLDSGVDEE